MAEPITLSNGSLRCEIMPDLGGCIAGLWLGELPVLRSTPPAGLQSARLSGSYPLVPFSNRVGHATLKWQGTSHPLVKNNGSEPHAIHGLGWQRPWQVLEQDDQSVMLAFEHRPDASWPFAFDASQTFRLRGNTLEMTLGMTNQSATPSPAGLGWHPYFVKRSRSHVSFAAGGRWDMDDEKLPTQRRLCPGLDDDCAALDVDHCFDGWTGLAQLRDELLHTRVTSSLGRLVVFTNPTRDFVAIEPVSHVNNALNLLHAGAGNADELGVQVLAPGESMSAHMSIEVERAS